MEKIIEFSELTDEVKNLTIENEKKNVLLNSIKILNGAFQEVEIHKDLIEICKVETAQGEIFPQSANIYSIRKMIILKAFSSKEIDKEMKKLKVTDSILEKM